jgi:predicted fused transcriptional regulator/phosphomethylpyrimidine kinase
VPDPVLGLRELGRVAKREGRIVLLEHVRSARRPLGTLMDLVNPVVVRMVGANVDRRAVENVRRAGLVVESVKDLGLGDIFKLSLHDRGPDESELGAWGDRIR